MVIQYALNIKNVEQDDFFEKIRKKYPLRDQRIDKFYNEKDRVRCLYAEVITRYALFNLGVDSNSVVIERDINGKPQLSNTKNLHFNISHSGDWVVCAISSSDVGIDVEEIKDNYIMDIAKNCLTDNEYGQLLYCEQCTQVSKFYKFWTLKESYMKMTGRGMSLPLDSFEVVPTEEGFVLGKSSERPCFFETMEFDGYIFSVSSERAFSLHNPLEIAFDDIYV